QPERVVESSAYRCRATDVGATRRHSVYRCVGVAGIADVNVSRRVDGKVARERESGADRLYTRRLHASNWNLLDELVAIIGNVEGLRREAFRSRAGAYRVARLSLLGALW